MSNFTCKAIPVRQPSGTFYVAAVNASDLKTICRPLRRPSNTGLFGRDTSEPLQLSEKQLDSLVRSLESPKFHTGINQLLSEERAQPYQRFLDEKRAVEIARYLQQPSALLPNSIILAVNIELDESDVVHQSEDKTVEIVLPQDENSAVILDGQHRVAAFRYLNDDIRSEFQAIVTFLVGIPFYQQAEIFAVINGKQKPVNKSIIYDLFGYAPVGRDKDERLYEGLMAIARFCSHIARILEVVEQSPWKDRIKMRGPGDDGLISQAAVVEYLTALVEPKTFSSRLKVYPLLYNYFKVSDPVGCASLLILYLCAIQAALPNYFANSKSLLWKNNGVAVIMRILHDDILLEGDPMGLMNNYPRIVDRWRKAPIADIENPPRTGGGGIQNELYGRFKKAMFSSRELEMLASAQDKLKEKLVKLGGLIN